MENSGDRITHLLVLNCGFSCFRRKSVSALCSENCPDDALVSKNRTTGCVVKSGLNLSFEIIISLTRLDGGIPIRSVSTIDNHKMDGIGVPSCEFQSACSEIHATKIKTLPASRSGCSLSFKMVH